MAKSMSRGQGPRIRGDELEQMLQLYSEGKSLKAIARITHRHSQAVRKYVLKELKEQEGKDARKEALKSALTKHFQDMVDALDIMRKLLVLPVSSLPPSEQANWPPGGLDRRNNLLLVALRQDHTSASPLWGLWEKWCQEGKPYAYAFSQLPQEVDGALEDLQRLYGDSILVENLRPVLLKKAQTVDQGSEGYLASLLEVKPGDESGGDLWLGNSAHLTAGRGEEMKQELTRMFLEMAGWSHVREAVDSLKKLMIIKDKMEDEIEILSLRRAFPGRCRLCPV